MGEASLLQLTVLGGEVGGEMGGESVVDMRLEGGMGVGGRGAVVEDNMMDTDKSGVVGVEDGGDVVDRMVVDRMVVDRTVQECALQTACRYSVVV